jgi:hypothetical protein
VPPRRCEKLDPTLRGRPVKLLVVWFVSASPFLGSLNEPAKFAGLPAAQGFGLKTPLYFGPFGRFSPCIGAWPIHKRISKISRETTGDKKTPAPDRPKFTSNGRQDVYLLPMPMLPYRGRSQSRADGKIERLPAFRLPQHPSERPVGISKGIWRQGRESLPYVHHSRAGSDGRKKDDLTGAVIRSARRNDLISNTYGQNE